MTDADTPHVPDLWRCDRCGSDRWVGWRAGPEHEGYPRKAQCVPCGHVQDPPADAVKLGDVGTEMLGRLGAENMRDRYKAALESCEVVLAQCQAERDRLADELRNLRADIRAELDDYAGSERDHYAGQSLYRSIALRLDCEPGREEPTYGKPLKSYVAGRNDRWTAAPAPREEPHCICFVTPESQWTTHYDATEPGSMREPNPECPVHFAHGHVVEHQPEEGR